jgi:biopolymer transport protein ExbB
MTFIEIFEAGGPIMWPLAICSLVAVAIIIERAINLRGSRILNRTIVERISDLIVGDQLDRAIEICDENDGVFASIISAGLEMIARGGSQNAAKEAIENAGRHEAGRLNRYLGVLGTVVGISPLLGLLGTVTGMIQVFNTIAASGGGASELSGGISEALITTATGLLIAIPALVAYNYYRGKVETIVMVLEGASLRILRDFYQPVKPRITETGN